jgi:hypothetical protein
LEPSLPTRYDWFSVSVEAEPAHLVGVYSRELQAEPRNVRALNGYQRAVAMYRGQDEEVRVQWSDVGRPNVLATGFPSQRVYELTTQHFPRYSLARGDVCVDFEDADMFEVAHGAMRRLSHERGIKHHLRGDWETPGSPDGRTTYSGALGKSTVVRRLYEFAKCHGYGLPVRLEIEVKPQSKHKHRYAGLGPIELLQTDGYTVELLRRLGYTLERLRLTRETPQTLAEQWFSHLVRQYGRKLADYVDVHLGGDSQRLGPALIAAYHAEVEHRRQVSHAAAENVKPLTEPQLLSGSN